ncbi:MAG: hypothetical protein NTV57_02495 [Cyanobacteria bacterium]|nr:hypothetical protein [Cyanobacteriota bacterium]
MSAPQSLLQAALGRLAARVGSGLVDTAAGLAVLAQDAPARLQQEWQLFWEEVELEAERLERGEASAEEAAVPVSWSRSAARTVSTDPQEQIDALRAQVADLARRLERPVS